VSQRTQELSAQNGSALKASAQVDPMAHVSCLPSLRLYIGEKVGFLHVPPGQHTRASATSPQRTVVPKPVGQQTLQDCTIPVGQVAMTRPYPPAAYAARTTRSLATVGRGRSLLERLRASFSRMMLYQCTSNFEKTDCYEIDSREDYYQ
jgi:hypothetical protein